MLCVTVWYLLIQTFRPSWILVCDSQHVRWPKPAQGDRLWNLANCYADLHSLRILFTFSFFWSLSHILAFVDSKENTVWQQLLALICKHCSGRTCVSNSELADVSPWDWDRLAKIVQIDMLWCCTWVGIWVFVLVLWCWIWVVLLVQHNFVRNSQGDSLGDAAVHLDARSG